MTAEALLAELEQSPEGGKQLVWREGMSAWAPAGQVPELSGRIARPLPSFLSGSSGAAPPAVSAAEPSPWFVVGEVKLVVMTFATFGLYQIYWFYRHWRSVRVGENDVWPLPRAIFGVLFCYPMFTKIMESASAAGVPVGESAGAYAVVFIALSVAHRLPDPWWLVTFLSVVPLVAVQRVVNAVARLEVPEVDPNTRLTLANWVLIVFGGLWWLLVLVGLFLPDPVEP